MPGQDKKTNMLAAHNVGSDGDYADVVMWVGDASDPTKGKLIEQATLDAFTITENMFTLLPTMVFQIITKGRFYSYDNIKVGDIVNIILTPKKRDDDEMDPEPYLKCSFLVQTIINDPLPNSGNFLNKYICIHPSQRYLSETSSYPSLNNITDTQYQKTTSTVVLDTILNECGLHLDDNTDDGEINDLSYWINCNETRAMFANRIVEHAWAGRGNSPLLYTDIEGNTHYKTIKDICKSEKDKGHADTKYVFMKTLNHNNFDPNNKENVIAMQKVYAINAAGPILNKGGYSLNYSVYNPYNSEKIPSKQNSVSNALSSSDEAIPVYRNSKIPSIGSSDSSDERSNGYRNLHLEFDKNLLATIPNRQPSEKDVVTLNNNGGIYFEELHQNYDLAPIHNEQVRRNFFQQFVKVSVDENRQLKCFQNKAIRPHLGDTIYLDTSSEDKPDVVYTGRYCVVEIQHGFGNHKPYSLEIVVANDGYYGDQHE